jgi:hypothetical protein
MQTLLVQRVLYDYAVEKSLVGVQGGPEKQANSFL